MKIGNLVNPGVGAALTKLFQANLKKEIAFKIKRLVISTDAEITKYNQLRNSLIEEFASKDEKGEVQKDEEGNVVFTSENKIEFLKKQTELQNMDVLIQTVKLSELGDAVLSAADLFALDEIIRE
jgi:hypothetical protein